MLHKETYEWFDIGFDHFGRTSTPLHTEICQEIYKNLGENDYLETQSKDQTYCEGCQRFLADRFVEGICPHCGFEDARGDQCDFCSRTLDAIELIKPRCLVNKTHNVVARTSTHMYVKLDALQPRTEEWIKSSARRGKWSPNSVINSDGEIIDARMKAGLVPAPLTRDLVWGVPVPPLGRPDDNVMTSKVLYVWYDAPIGYPSITANYTPEWKKWWFNPKDVHLYQFMGKDNVYFHTVYFPSIQLGDKRNWTSLYHLSTTEYLNYEGGKFSKSRNRGVFGPQAKETGIPSSVWRYYLLSTRPESADAMFSWNDCITANNNVLLNKCVPEFLHVMALSFTYEPGSFGNFVNRVLKFISSQYQSIIPDSGDEPGPLSPNDEHDSAFVSDVNRLLQEYIDAMDAVKLRQGLQTVMAISQQGNGYLQSSGLNKALMVSDPKRCAQVVSRAINLIYVLSALTYPYMPAISAGMLNQLNAPARAVPDVLGTDILAGHTIGTPEHLFKKIDEGMADKFKAQFGGNEVKVTSPEAPPATTTTAKPKAKGKKDVAAPVYTGEMTPEMKSKEEEITKQGDVIRTLKAQTKTAETEAQVKQEVETLKKLKAELSQLQNL
ncbi:hypothetical protein D9757_002381 [Collybiopsis confluens]|uniref:methionine--tRNA ligase n=1 Tax=Collybiopsis confluens TaxID=2823264 RepID=A0A8H5HY94_9AGAR|nr:hypothetical protein D9757_002381 [Collybiopsis confluens]